MAAVIAKGLTDYFCRQMFQFFAQSKTNLKSQNLQLLIL